MYIHVRKSYHFTICISDTLLFTHFFKLSLLFFIVFILVYVHFCRWQGGILRNLYSGKVICVYPVSILYVVYSVVAVDLLRKVESCVVCVRAGKTCDLVVNTRCTCVIRY
jgi:hypothetical protein